MTTKEKILEEIKDINYAYNDCSKYNTIKYLLEEMEEELNEGIWTTHEVACLLAEATGDDCACNVKLAMLMAMMSGCRLSAYSHNENAPM